MCAVRKRFDPSSMKRKEGRAVERKKKARWWQRETLSSSTRSCQIDDERSGKGRTGKKAHGLSAYVGGALAFRDIRRASIRGGRGKWEGDAGAREREFHFGRALLYTEGGAWGGEREVTKKGVISRETHRKGRANLEIAIENRGLCA